LHKYVNYFDELDFKALTSLMSTSADSNPKFEMRCGAFAAIKNQGHECNTRTPRFPVARHWMTIVFGARYRSRVSSSSWIQSVSSARTRRIHLVCLSRSRVTTIHQHAVGP